MALNNLHKLGWLHCWPPDATIACFRLVVKARGKAPGAITLRRVAMASTRRRYHQSWALTECLRARAAVSGAKRGSLEPGNPGREARRPDQSHYGPAQDCTGTTL